MSGKTVATGKTFKVGMILGAMAKDFSSHHFARIICSLSAELQKENYTLTLLQADLSKNMDEQVCNFLMSGIADAYITGESMLGEKVFTLLKKLNVPLRTVYTPRSQNPSVRHVILRKSAALRQIWNSIPEQMRQKTLFFANDIPDNQTPLRDIKDAAAEVFTEKIHIETLLYKRNSNFNAFEYRDALKTAYANQTLLKNYKVIWCESDFTAAALLDFFEEQHIEPGRDVLLIGTGDLENYYDDRAEAQIATIDFNAELIGRELAASVIAEINGKQVSNSIIEASFIPRRTFPLSKEIIL